MTSQPAEGTSDSVLKVLIIDDDPDITNVLKRGLESLGYRIDAFNQPAQAIELCDPTKYDVGILDIRMPIMNGFEVARALWRKNEKLQICFLSAFEINESEAKGIMPSLKSHWFVKKPISPRELAGHIKSHFLHN